jgi:hypothetical protein
MLVERIRMVRHTRERTVGVACMGALLGYGNSSITPIPTAARQPGQTTPGENVGAIVVEQCWKSTEKCCPSAGLRRGSAYRVDASVVGYGLGDGLSTKIRGTPMNDRDLSRRKIIGVKRVVAWCENGCWWKAQGW